MAARSRSLVTRDTIPLHPQNTSSESAAQDFGDFGRIIKMHPKCSPIGNFTSRQERQFHDSSTTSASSLRVSCSSAGSRYNSTASRIFCRASSRVLPCDQQLFSEGHRATEIAVFSGLNDDFDGHRDRLLRPRTEPTPPFTPNDELSQAGPQSSRFGTRALSRPWLQRLVELSRCAAGPETAGVNLDVYGMHAGAQGG
jgi:hypothetical protein